MKRRKLFTKLTSLMLACIMVLSTVFTGNVLAAESVIEDVVVKTSVIPAGQYPETIKVTVSDPAVLEGLEPSNFSISGQATSWLSSSLHSFTATIGDVAVDGNEMTLTFGDFPEKYVYVDNYTVTCSTNADLTFKVTKDTTTITPIADEFEKIRDTSGSCDPFDYNLFTPEDTSKPQPIVIAFHGYGDEENLYHNKLAVAWADPANQAERPCYVLAPMLSGLMKYQQADSRQAVYTYVYDKVQEMIEAGQVDPDRIYVTGKSYGGGATYEFLLTYPDLAAGAIAMCGETGSPYGNIQNRLAEIAHIPLWIAHATTDPTVSVSDSRNAYQGLLDAGSTVVKFTEYSDEEMSAAGVTPEMSNHSSEAVVLEDVRYMEWLFAQSKGGAVDVPTLDYSALETAIAAAEAVDAEAYTEESYAAVAEALDAAKALLDNAENQEAIDAATAAINNAIEALEEVKEPIEIEDIVVNTEVIPAGQYPTTVEVTVSNPAGLENLTAEDFTVAGQASAWLTSSLHDFTATISDVALVGDVLTLTFGNFPEKYVYVDNYTVTCSANEDLTFAVTKETTTITPIADEFEQVSGSFAYNLYTPEDTSTPQPIVLAFHGFGDDANLYHNKLAVAWADPANQAERPSYVLAPVFSGYTYLMEAQRKAVYANVYDKLQEMIDAGQVDPNRIYVTGKSYGGGATYEFLETYPDLAAGAIVMCGQSTSPYSNVQANLGSIVDVPLWIAHATTDPTVKVSNAQDAYAKLLEAGSTVVHYTEYSDEEMTAAGVTPEMSNHSMEAVVLEDVAYMEWLFAQVRVENKLPFEDVKTSDYFYDAVLWAVENGITTGKDATHFAPAGNSSRAEVVTFLWRAAGQPEATIENPFTDVKESDYYYEAVLWAYENGITAGKTATTFAPKASCTRAEVVTFLWRAEGRPEATATENPFTDVAARDYFYDAVLWAVEEGITAGTTETTFGSYTSCTRAQIVSFLYRANN